MINNYKVKDIDKHSSFLLFVCMEYSITFDIIWRPEEYSLDSRCIIMYTSNDIWRIVEIGYIMFHDRP